MSVLVECSQPAVVPVTGLYSDCHLYDCWPLAGRDEKFADLPLPLLNCRLPMFFQVGLSCLLSDRPSDFLSTLS